MFAVLVSSVGTFSYGSSIGEGVATNISGNKGLELFGFRKSTTTTTTTTETTTETTTTTTTTTSGSTTLEV